MRRRRPSTRQVRHVEPMATSTEATDVLLTAKNTSAPATAAATWAGLRGPDDGLIHRAVATPAAAAAATWPVLNTALVHGRRRATWATAAARVIPARAATAGSVRMRMTRNASEEVKASDWSPR